MQSRKTMIALKFLFAALLIGFCIPLDSIDVFKGVFEYELSVDLQYFWLNSIIYGGVFGGYFTIVLATFVYADSFCTEYHSGIWRYLIARKGMKGYTCKKILNGFLLGGLSASAGGLLFLLPLCLKLPLFDVGRLEEVTFLPFYEILKESAVGYFAVMLYLIFLSGGFWSVMSICFSAFAPVCHMVYVFPFVASFLLTRINTMLSVPNQWRINFLLRGRSGPKDAGLYLLLVTTMVFFFVILGSGLFYKKVKRRISYE